jgi:hydrogenase large subunit
VCTYVHGETSLRCVENALGIWCRAMRVVRNLLMRPSSSTTISSLLSSKRHGLGGHHFCLECDPAATASLATTISQARRQSILPQQNRLQTLVSSGQLGIFAGAYCTHEAYLLTLKKPVAAAHYLEALKLQASRTHAYDLRREEPHVQSLQVGGHLQL